MTYDTHIENRLSSSTTEEKEIVEFFNFDNGECYSFFYDEDFRQQHIDQFRYDKMLQFYWPLESKSILEGIDFFDEGILFSLMQKLKKVIDSDKNFVYHDNYRFAKVGDKKTENLYKIKRSKGCCGFYDEEHEIDGVMYKIGFNFGH